MSYPISVTEGIAAPAQAAPAPQAAPAQAAPQTVVTGSENVSAPMPGLVLRIPVSVGQSVKKDEIVMVMEAMKMENEIYAPCDGVISSIAVSQGQQLQAGDLLLTIGGVAAPAPQAAPVQAAPAPQPAPVEAAPAPQAAPAAAPAAGDTEIKAPMPGLALRFEVKVGDTVQPDQVLMVMEAMKMENEIYSPCAGTVKQILVNQGEQLQADTVLMIIG